MSVFAVLSCILILFKLLAVKNAILYETDPLRNENQIDDASEFLSHLI